MARYLTDSDVLIWVLRNRRDTVDLLTRLAEETGEPLACSAISILEIWNGAKPSETRRTSIFLETLQVIPIDHAIARLAAQLLKSSRREKSSREWVDAMIAATAVQNRMTLLTYNRKDYPYTDITLYPL